MLLISWGLTPYSIIRYVIHEDLRLSRVLNLAELHHDVGVHDGDGTDQAQARDGAAAGEPEKDGEGYQTSDWGGVDAGCASPSGDLEGREEG